MVPAFDRNDGAGGNIDRRCTQGAAAWVRGSVTIANATGGYCESGAQSQFAKCLVPVYQPTTSDPPIAGCVSGVNNYLFGVPRPSDTRSFNIIQRLGNTGATNGNIVRDEQNAEAINAYYRIHSISAVNDYEKTCNEPDSTDQIACTVQAEVCSTGYARSACDFPGAFCLEVCDVEGSEENMLDFSYPLTRYLYVNSYIGFSNVTEPEQLKLYQCFNNPAISGPAATASGLLKH